MIRRLKALIAQRNPLRLLWHRSKALLAALRYGFPARKLTVIGITGTDGKTTTVGMVAHILQKQGIAVGALSTAFFQVRDEIVWNATQKTSPSPFVIQHFLRHLVSIDCTHVVLEYSSHGLVQGRGDWTWPAVAAITNTSFEHLDYHGSMEQYRRDKGRLFKKLRSDGTKILNRDDVTFLSYTSIPSAHTMAYGQHPPEFFSDGDAPLDAFLWVTDAKGSATGSTAMLHSWQLEAPKEQSAHELVLEIPGLFNIENALCALTCAQAVGVSPEASLRSLRSFRGVPGRLEKITGPQPFTVFVDFTVTPIAYEKTLKALRSILEPGKRLLVLTGSCGDRMREKRPEIGRICSELADVVVVTNEDPYTEDPVRIIEEVWSGIDASKVVAHKIPDRLEAIRLLFALAKSGDIVILCGKGSDTTMMTREGQIPWNERLIAQELLRELSPE